MHVRDGHVYSLLENDHLDRVASFRCGDYSFCKMTIITLDHRLLACLPSTETADALSIWDMELGQILIPTIKSETENHGNVMCSQLIQHDARLLLLAGFDDGVLRAFELDLEIGEFKLILQLKLFEQTVTCLEYNEQKDSIILGGPKSDLVMIKHLFTDDHQILRTLVANEGFSYAVFSPSANLIITGGWDGK